MKKITTFLAAATFTAAMSSTAFAAAPEVYVVNFRNDKNAESQSFDQQLNSALSMVQGSAQQVVFDTSTAAKWEKSAHEAFDHEIVPVFNKWIGLPGFAAIVDARTKNVVGCVNNTFHAYELANEIKRMSDQATGRARLSSAAFSKTTACPAAYNQPPTQ